VTVAFGPDVEESSAEEVLAEAVERFHPRLYVACSFQKEAAVILDMVLRIEPEVRVFTVDTGVLFAETYETWREVERRYGIEIDVYQGMALARQATLHGDALWSRDPDACCSIRKVNPLKEALSQVDAWISGVRRDQSTERADSPKLGWDDRHGLWKVNPLADWAEDEVWDYIARYDLPVNPLHQRGYGSIGCTHCTHPGPGREGRWAGLEKTECGLHG
jgi:phosphoadenosine phosphosulfate reductase